MAGSIIDTILQMKQQGFDDNQIYQSLIQAGYKPEDVMTGFSQAQLKENITGQGMPQDFNQPVNSMSPNFASVASPDDYMAGSRRQMEEVVEAVVEEKWSDLIKNVDKIIQWKDKVDGKFTELETEFKNLKEGFDKLHTNILSKVGEYDTSIKDVGAEINALEKVFQKLLPSFTQNVSDLSRIVKDMKK